MFDLNNLTDMNGDGVINHQDAELADIDLADIAASFNEEFSDLADNSIELSASAEFEPSFGGLPSAWNDIMLQIAKHPHYVTEALESIGNNVGDALGHAFGSGEVNAEAAAEAFHIASANGAQGISFGSSSLSPAEWQNGVAYSEITPENMDAMADQITSLFVQYGVDTYAVNGFENAAMSTEHPDFYYDPNLMWTLGQRYGADAITGITGHEIGHHIVEEKLADDINVTGWQHELCADYISGIVSELHNVDHDVMHDLYADPGFAPASDSHPSGGLRSQAYDMGVEWAQNNTNNVFHEFLLTSESQLESMFQGVLDIFPGSYSEYIGL